MKPIQIAKEILGDLSDDILEFIIWEYTGYPSFFDGNPEECFRAQLREFKELGQQFLDAERELNLILASYR